MDFASGTDLNPVLEAIANHRSVRFFKPERCVDDETLGAIINAAQRASTSSNMQMWSVIAVRDPHKRKAIRAICRGQAFVEEAPLFLVFCADIFRLRRVAESRSYAFAYGGVDLLLAATIDSALACQNATLAAESLGLGCCMVGGIRNQARELGRLLDLPHGVFGSIGLALGYPARINPVKPRLPRDVVLHTDRYCPTNHVDGISRYDKTMEATGIYDNRRVQVDGVTPAAGDDTAPYGWVEHTARRLARGNQGRRAVGKFLDEQGFELE
jgi:nitroreductase